MNADFLICLTKMDKSCSSITIKFCGINCAFYIFLHNAWSENQQSLYSMNCPYDFLVASAWIEHIHTRTRGLGITEKSKVQEFCHQVL